MNVSDTVRLEKIPCPVGCSENDAYVLSGRDLLHDLPGEFTVVECKTCGLMRTNPRPTPDTIGVYYPDNYGPYLGTKVQPAAPARTSAFKKLLKLVFKWVFNFKTESLPHLTPGRLLEVGCASGSFMHRMAGQGWLVEGIEFSATAAKAATQLGYKVHTGPLETAPEPKEPFDLIVGWMVLEHLHDPVGGLRKLRQWAKPDARLVLSVPNAGSLEFHIFKEKWYALQVPTHLQHFTPESIRALLQAGGWKVEKIHHQRVLSNLIASTGHVLRSKGCEKLGQRLIDFPDRAGKVVYLLYPLAWLLSIFGQTGRMTVWAKKAT